LVGHRTISHERGVKGDGVAGEASGGGRWWRLKGRRASRPGVVLVVSRRRDAMVRGRSFSFC